MNKQDMQARDHIILTIPQKREIIRRPESGKKLANKNCILSY
jgi:hypothetical protein